MPLQPIGPQAIGAPMYMQVNDRLDVDRRFCVIIQPSAVHPEKLSKIDWPVTELTELFDAAALTEEGAYLVRYLGNFEGMTTYFDLEHPKKVEFEPDESLDINLVRRAMGSSIQQVVDNWVMNEGKTAGVDWGN